jgi:hypothetical protein
MSTHDSSHSSGDGGTRPEDRIDFKKVVAVGVVSLVIFALSTWWAIAILHGERAEMKGRAEGHVTAEMGKSEIGIVDQVPFDSDHRLERWRHERAEHLHGYGWVDRAHNLIHIPIERAMDEIIAGAVPAAAPAAAPAPAPAPAPGARPSTGGAP